MRAVLLLANDPSAVLTETNFRRAWAGVQKEVGRSTVVEAVRIDPSPAAALKERVAAALLGQVDVVVAPTPNMARAVTEANVSVPVVFSTYADPVSLGLVANARRPSGRATGVSLSDNLHAKRLEILRDAFPGTRALGVLVDRSMVELSSIDTEVLLPAHRLGFVPHVIVADDEAELRAALARPDVQALDAWYVPPTYVSYLAESWLGAALTRAGRPAMHATRREVEQGALMAYESDGAPAYDVLARMTAQVLRGGDPAQMPVWRPMRFVLVVRPRQAVPGLRIAPAVVRRADHVL